MKNEKTFRFNDFIVYVNDASKNQIFIGLNFKEEKDGKYYRVITDIFVFIDLIEILKAFAGNKLNINKIYNLSDVFTATIVQKNAEKFLRIHFKNYSNSLHLCKFKCSALAAKFQKIIQRCEVWQELEA